MLLPSILGALLAVLPAIAQPAAHVSEKEAEAIGIEAYIYGYPLITMEITRRELTNVEAPSGSKGAPMGQFSHLREYPNASFKAVTAPNADTLYSTAWLDLSQEPIILHVPDEKGRYYLMPMLSGWTDVFASPGTRTQGTDAADYAITGPGWEGTLPEGVKQIQSPTQMVWIIGRTYCTGTPEDYKAVHALQDQYTLTPLSAYGRSYTPPKGTVDPKKETKKPVRDQVNSLSAADFFAQLARLMKANPPAVEDAAMIVKMDKIGLIPGQEFDLAKLDANMRRGLERAPKQALEKIMAHQKNAGKLINGWEISLKTGLYGTDYLQRALVAVIGLGANLPQDAVYPYTQVDNEGKPLSGENRYMIHFLKDQTPPANGFWSLTMYNDQYFFVNNPLQRFSISPRNNLTYNLDGSLDLYVQHQSPGKEKEPNWLPAPKDKFILMMRLYWPKDSLLDGSWQPPAVKRVK